MSNEITLKLKCSINEMCKILEDKKFKIVDKFTLNDTYYIPINLDIKILTPREILSKCILLREIKEYLQPEKVYKLTYKKKEIDEKGNIINQNKIDCRIYSIVDGRKILEAINYKKIMNIKENNIVYEKDGFEIAVKDILNGDNLIEIETVKNNIELDTIEKLKVKLNELQLPINTNDYFVKKAEIELKKIL